MADHDIELVSGWFSGRLLEVTVDEEKSRIKQQLELYQAMGCPLMVYAETVGTVQGLIDTPVSQRPKLTHDQIKRYGEKLTHFAEFLESEHCPMSFHHHMGTVIEVEEEVDLLMEHTDKAVGLLLDTGHLTFAGGDVTATTERWGHRINHVHTKDIRADVLEKLKAEDWSFLKGVLEGCLHRPRRRLDRFCRIYEVLEDHRLFGLGGDRGRAGPEEGQPAEDGRDRHGGAAGGGCRGGDRDRFVRTATVAPATVMG